MKKTEKKVPNEFDSLSIVELEKRVEQNHLLSREAQKEMYVMLEYLRTSNRYKENPRYKKSLFWEYLEDRFTIRQGTYRENARAFLKYPEYAVEYGVGLVTKIDRVCGKTKVDKVIGVIAKETATHKKPLDRTAIENIIQANRSTPRIEKVITDWKAMYEAERAGHEETKKALKVAVATVNELRQQVDMLKRTAETFGKVRDVLEGYDGEIMARIQSSYKETPVHA
jgi:hypothetical protein